MKKTLLSFSCIIAAINAFAQSPVYKWARNAGGNFTTKGIAVTSDAAGNVYTAGHFTGTTNFEPTTATNLLTSNGDIDIFVTKHDATGKLIWAKNMGGATEDKPFSICVDASENVYLSGSFTGTADFDPGAGVQNLSANGGTDIFVAKLNSSGTFAFAKSIGGTGDDVGNSICLDGSGNILTTGQFFGTVDFDPGTTSANLISAGSGDIFVSKLSPSGNYVWAKSMGSPDNDCGNSIATDAKGNVYTSGHFSNYADLDPGLTAFIASSKGVRDVFITKLNSSGAFVWAKNMGGPTYDGSRSVSLDASGNVYSVGYFNGFVNFDVGKTDFTLSATSTEIFVSKFDTGGKFVWAKNMKGNFQQYGKPAMADKDGNVFVTGYYSGTVDFDAGTPVANLSSAGKDDIFIARFDPMGKFVSVSGIGGSSYDYSAGISVDASKNIYCTGDFYASCDFDPSTANASLTSSLIGLGDAFMVNWNYTPSSISETSISNTIVVSPNPTNGKVKIDIRDEHKAAEIEVFNLTGSLVYKIINAKSQNELDLSNHAAGVYFIKVYSEGSLIGTQKMIKQ